MRAVKRAEIRRRALRALELVKLADRADSKPRAVRRPAAARGAGPGIGHRAAMPAARRALSNLDAKLRLEMRAEIRRICKEGA
jgi:iron(III) transport system ATP-binding protein